MWQSERMRAVSVAVVASVVAGLGLGGCADCVSDPDPAPKGPDLSGPLAVVLLVEGDPYLYGNDEYMPLSDCIPRPGDPPPSPSVPCHVSLIGPGIYRTLEHALDDQVPALAAARPDARGAIVLFDDGARVIFDGPIAQLTGARLPAQRDQRAHVGRELGAGLRLAADTLHAAPATRRVLIVITDGSAADRTPAADDPIRQQLAADHVELIVLGVPDDTIWEGADPMLPGLEALHAIGARVRRVRRPILPAALERLFKQLGAGQPITETP
jgi:hypothetical protein